MDDCIICKNQTNASYEIYVELENLHRLKLSLGGKTVLTGNTRVFNNFASGKKDTYVQYLLPVCRRCTYAGQIKFNAIFIVSAIIVGLIIRSIPFPAHLWGWKYVPYIFYGLAAINLIALIVYLIKYMRDMPSEDLAAPAVRDHLNKGLKLADRVSYQSFAQLHNGIGKFGSFTPGTIYVPGGVSAAYTPNSTAESPHQTQANGKKVCSSCGKSLKYPNEVSDGRMDGVARVCVRCGSEICVHCLQQLPQHEDKFGRRCAVCAKYGIFELGGKPEEMMKSLALNSEKKYGAM